MRGAALVKCIFLFIDFKGSLESGTHIVNAHHGLVGPSHPILETLVLSLRILAVRNVDFQSCAM